MSAYSSAVLADSPSWYWRFPFSGQNAVPSIGAHGDWLAGGTAAGFQWAWTGPGGDAGSYLGVSGAQVFGQTNVSIGPDFAMEYWTYCGGNQYGTTQATALEFQLATGTPTSLFWGMGRTVLDWSLITHAGPISTSGIARTELAWHHLVLTTNATGFDFYVDGVNVHSFTGTHDTFSGFTVTLQRAIAVPTWFAEPAVYSAILSSASVAAHYNAGSLSPPSYSPGLASCA